MLHALQRAFFGGPKSYAALNRTKFDPIPLGSIALVCTIVCTIVLSHFEHPSDHFTHYIDRTLSSRMGIWGPSSSQPR